MRKQAAHHGRPAPSGKPSEHFESEWRRLVDAFEQILDYVESGCRKPPHLNDRMNTYTIVYNLCTRTEGTKNGINAPQILYQRANDAIERYLGDRVTRKVADKTGEPLLENVYQAWDHHQLVVKWCRFMFQYLDSYFTRQAGVDNLRIMMLKCFRSAVYEKIKQDLCSVLLKEVQKEREGLSIHRVVMKSAIELYVEMGMDSIAIYERDFEIPFIEATAAFYERQAATWLMESGGAHTYLGRVERSLNEEHQRSLSYLHPHSQPSVIRCVEEHLLQNHQTRVLEDPDAGTEALLHHWKKEELGRMHSLFKRVPSGLEPMALIVREYIKKEGATINKKFCDGEVDGTQYIDTCLELHDKYTVLFKEQFETDANFERARKDAYEVFINDCLQLTRGGADSQTKVTSSELLSTYCDNLMKNEKITPDELEEKLDKIVILFMYISDKDLFQEFYRKQMSKRLLVSKTDNDPERQLISKLKMKMGAPYTSKLEGMIVDKGLSEETQKSFLEFCNKNNYELRIDFCVQVLTTGFWPAFKMDPLKPPEELSHSMSCFKRFYDDTTQSRVLKWVHSLGTATCSSRFKKGQKEMILSTYQTCVILLFNSNTTCSISDMLSELDLPVDEVKRTVHSVAFGRFPILKKQEGSKPGKSIAEDDVFMVNEEFSCPQRKFKVPSIIRSVGGDPVEKTDETRRHVIEAYIVRIMKSRKQLSHSELQAETIKQLSHLFKPDPKVIKKRIEDLISRQYLERDTGDRSWYRYLA